MMKKLSKTSCNLAIMRVIALRMAFALWLLLMAIPALAQEHYVSLHLNHVCPCLKLLMRLSVSRI